MPRTLALGWLALIAGSTGCYETSSRESGHGQRADATTGLVQPLDRFAISDASQQAGPPTLRFIDDHWLVGWPVIGAPPQGGDYHLEVATIDADATQVERRIGPALDGWWPPELTFDAKGRLGMLHNRDDCTHQVFERDLQPRGPAFRVRCSRDNSMVAATPVPDTNEWMIAFASADLVGDVVVGRYEPSLSKWTSGSIVLASRSPTARLDVFVPSARDALVLWGNAFGSTTLQSVDLRARSSAAAGRDPFQVTRAVISDAGYALTRLEDRTLLMGVDESGLWTAVLDESGVVAESELARSVVLDRRPGVAVAGELGVIGACYGTSTSPRPVAGGSGPEQDGVAFVLLDRAGEVIGTPSVIAERLENFGGCDVAWSGEEFLVVYWHIEIARADRGQFTSQIFGRRVRVGMPAPR